MLPDVANPRKRRLVMTLGAATMFVVVAAIVTWVFAKPEEPHRPGEAIEGITRELARSLPPDYPRVEFTDVTAAAGITYVHFQGERTVQLPEDMGSGAAWGDYDNDGWLDLFVTNQSGPLTSAESQVASAPARCELYHNEGDGRFTETAAATGVDCRGFGMGAAWGDYDNDGWLDLFVTFYGENRFYRNNGDGTFTDYTEATGLGGVAGFWTGA
ncbi:MAG: FG-GAP repeat domain-containing protein, partial [Gemmatimonadales bacterium]